jgi:hypothetical protein
MEILGIYWDMPVYALTGASTVSMYAFLTTLNPNLPASPTTGILQQVRAQGTTIDYINRQLVAGVAPTNELLVDEPIYHNLNDGDGNGVLVATDNLYITLITNVATATGAINNALARILYRWKEVSLEEYIGIVQAQK